MKKIIRLAAFSLSLLFLVLPSGLAAWVWSPEEGKFINPEEEVKETPQEQYDYAMDYYKKGDLKEAVHYLRILLKKFPGSHPAPEGAYQLGVIYEELGDHFRAFKAYRDLLQRYPQTERMSQVIEREFRIGNLFLSGRRAKLMGIGILPSGPRAIEVFKHIVETAPYSEFGDRAQFHLGLAHKRSNHFDEAIQAFQTLIDQYPSSKLVPQASYQIADTSYLESVVATRDQRAIDRAAKELDQFLKHHPDTSVSDKAARLRQEIDEKNAEKNYRIGLFYEKENYLDSALIYYRDVSARYPQTHWGGKAAERLRALERPEEYLKSQEAEIQGRKQDLLRQLESVPSGDEGRKKLEWELDRVKKEEKALQKSKPETLKRRRSALRQKQKELKEKRRALSKKKKRFAKNPSEDLQLAFQRWENSLEQEEAELAKEKYRIENWEENLGVSTAPFYAPLAHLVPFGRGELSPLEQVRQVEAKRFVELAKDKVELLRSKEDLYREYEKVVTIEGVREKEDEALRKEREKIEKQAEDVERVRLTLQEKEKFYEKRFGTSPWSAVWRVPTRVVSQSVGLLNPFEGGLSKDWASKSPEELKELESHWKEKVAAQKTLVDTIARAFDDELARTEESRLLAGVQEKEGDPAALRRTIKQLEREVRSRYNEIQDRDARKNELLEELDKRLHPEKSGEGAMATSGKIVASPAVGLFKFGRAFLFGLPQRDVALTEEAKRVSSTGEDRGAADNLRKEIELESLLIQARNREIQTLTRELDALRAKHSLSDSPAFRSLLVKFPYVFVREAVASAGRLVPKEDRQEKLIEQLNRETEKLETLKKELNELKQLVKGKPKGPSAEKTAPAPAPVSEEATPDRARLQAEMETLRRQLEFQSQTYEYNWSRFEETRWQKLTGASGGERTEKVRKIEEHLIELIIKEQRIHQEERELLSKKKEVVEQLLQKLPSDVFTRELNLEKKEIDSRLSEIQRRQSTLGEELKRFQPQGFPSS